MKKLILALMFFSASSSAEVYKCKVDGQLTFQDRPCASGKQEKLKLPSIGEPTNAGAAEDANRAYIRQVIEDAEWKERVRMAILRNKVIVGMTSKDLVKSWGRPTKINRSSSGADQWVYRHGGSSSQYVYVEDGVVAAWN